VDVLKEFAWHMDTVEGGLIEFAAFVVVVPGQTHIDPVIFAIRASGQADDMRSRIVVVDLGHTAAYPPDFL
jgi:hypothetical protein